MNTVNTNKEEVKYLTFDEIKEEFKKEQKYVSFSFEKMRDKDYIAEVDNLNIDIIILKLIQLSEYGNDIKLFHDYSSLFNDKNENKRRLLSRLLAVCENRVYSPNTIHVDYEKKMELLRKSFDVFDSLDTPNLILNSIFDYEYKYPTVVNVFDILLNKKEFLKYLLFFSDYKKQNPKYNKFLKDFFPEIKLNQSLDNLLQNKR
ncbi:hypothetical protein HDR59_04030 [bacterium]|nr:hypothetical protein [bacterium]